MYEFKPPVRVTPAILPERYAYDPEVVGDGNQADFLRFIRSALRAQIVNPDSLANAILKSGLSLEQILWKSDLLFHAIHIERADLFKLLLSIPGWDFSAKFPQTGMTVAHFAVDRKDHSFLYYLLLASSNPRKLLANSIDDGRTVLDLMLQIGHPLLPYLDSLTSTNYPPALFATFHSDKVLMNASIVQRDYPRLSGFIDGWGRCLAEHHFLSTLADVTRYVIPDNHSLGVIKYENQEPNGAISIEKMGEFFNAARNNNIRVTHFAEERTIFNPLTPSKRDYTLAGYIKSLKKRGRPKSAVERHDYDACVDQKNRTACATLVVNYASKDAGDYEGGYDPRQLTRPLQALCDYLENAILVVTAGNRGGNNNDEVNLHAMDLGCTEKQIRHRLVTTRLDYSADPTELSLLKFHSYSPSAYAVATTSFQSNNCSTHPLCVSFGHTYGTSNAAPQLLGMVMQIESVLRVNNVTYTADTVVDILDQGCVATTRPDLAKCLVDPPRVFEAAVKYAEQHKPKSTTKPKKAEPRKKASRKKKKVSPKVVSSNGFIDSIKAGVYSGVTNGMIRSTGNFMRQRGQQQGYSSVVAEAQAQAVMSVFLFALKSMVEQQDAMSAATETIMLLTIQ
nr:hypothetical protein [Gammaproteobacteria bacterium]